MKDSITVDAKALRALLVAVNSGSTAIMELMVTRNLPGEMGAENPINILINQFNEWAEKVRAAEAESEPKEG